MMGVYLNVQHHQQLHRAKPDVPIMFSIALKKDGKKSHLVLKQCLRVVPGKRVVALANWNGQEVIAKVFFHPKHSERHLKREASRLFVLNNAFIPSPKVLLEDESSHDSVIKVLLLERIFPADSFYDVWQHAGNDSHRRTILLRQAVELIAELHLYKLLQDDFHMNNLLIKDGKLYVIDAGMLKVHHRRISKRSALNNLARFLAQFSFEEDGKIEACFAIYAQQRCWKVSKKQLGYLKKRTRYWLKWRYQNLEKKLFRSCTQFNCIRFPRANMVIDRIYDSENFINEFYAGFSQEGHVSKQFLMIKVRRSFFGRDIKDLWRLANKLVVYGVSGPKPAAIIFERRLFSGGVVIVERPLGVPLSTFRAASVNEETRKRVYASLEEEKAKLRQLDFSDDQLQNAFVVVGEQVVLNTLFN